MICSNDLGYRQVSNSCDVGLLCNKGRGSIRNLRWHWLRILSFDCFKYYVESWVGLFLFWMCVCVCVCVCVYIYICYLAIFEGKIIWLSKPCAVTCEIHMGVTSLVKLRVLICSHDLRNFLGRYLGMTQKNMSFYFLSFKLKNTSPGFGTS
jgi:hypothetical protein